jgi:tRNA threonylcarbamoyladenosine biosynthesis protein TsaE
MSAVVEIEVGSPEATHALAARLGRALVGGEILALVGDLGSGKTTFVRGLAEGLAIDPGLVYSPTFTLVAEHPGRVPLRHVDLYRLPEPVGFDSAEEIGLDDVIAGSGVAAIEWFERLDPSLGIRATVEVAIAEGRGEAGRRLRFEGFGDRGAAIVAGLRDGAGE